MYFRKPFLRKRATTLPAPIPIKASGLYAGNDGQWSTFGVTVGTSNPPQTFNAMVSLSSVNSWFVVPDGCPTTAGVLVNCPLLRGDLRSGSPGWQPDMSSTANTLSNVVTNFGPQLDIGLFGASPVTMFYSSYANGTGYSLDNIQLNKDLASSATITAQQVPLFDLVDFSLFYNTLGLGYGTTQEFSTTFGSILTTLGNSSQIPSRSVGYTAGAFWNKTFGSLVLGGYDSSRFINPKVDFTMPGGTEATRLQVSVNTINIEYTGDKAKETASETVNRDMTQPNSAPQPFNAAIDSSLPFLYLPQTTCDSFESLLGLSYDNNTGLYLVNSTQRVSNLANIGSIQFIVSDYTNANGGQKTATISLPYSAFDFNMSWPVYTNDTPYFPIRVAESGADGVGILGRTFLQGAYIIADYERNNFTIANAVYSPSAGINPVAIYNLTQSAQNGQNGDDSGSSKLGAGAIVGIVIGALIGVIIVISLLWWFCYYKPRRDRAKQLLVKTHDEPPSPPLERANTAVSESVITYATELDSQSKIVRRPSNSRTITELSAGSDSTANMPVNVINPPNTIYELADSSHEIDSQRPNFNSSTGSRLTPDSYRTHTSPYAQKEREAFADGSQTDSLYGGSSDRAPPSYSKEREAFGTVSPPSVTSDGISRPTQSEKSGRSNTVSPMPPTLAATKEEPEEPETQTRPRTPDRSGAISPPVRDGAISPSSHIHGGEPDRDGAVSPSSPIESELLVSPVRHGRESSGTMLMSPQSPEPPSPVLEEK
jgi:hypothetical protein